MSVSCAPAPTESPYVNKPRSPHPLDAILAGIGDFHPLNGEATTFGSQISERYQPGCTAVTVGNDRGRDG